MTMKTFSRNITVALAIVLGGLVARTASAEPLMTVVGFTESAYDNRAGNAIAVKVTRTDQDPATESVPLTVDLAVAGGTAVENVDYRFADGADGKPGRITFAPGVREKVIVIYALAVPGSNKTLQLALSNPAGPAASVTGDNPTATVTIVNP
jgi:hypothetical protein